MAAPPPETDPIPALLPAVAAQEGDDGDNVLVGDAPNDELFGLGGDDILRGASGDDSLDGGDGRDTLLGDEGDDILVGGSGSDYLDGGAGSGDDALTGGFIDPDSGRERDSDQFAFGRVDGNDTITDFDPGCPICDVVETPDRIVLASGSQEDITVLIADASETDSGDAVLHYGETTVTLTGVSPDALYPEMFIPD